MKNTILFLFFIFIFISTGYATNQCVDLFLIPVQNTIHSTDDKILKHVDDLVALKFKIDSKGFENDNQQNQALLYFTKALNAVMIIDPKYLAIFKQRFLEKFSKFAEVLKDKDEARRILEEQRRLSIMDSLDVVKIAMARKMIFHEMKTENSTPFAMMNTLVTQVMWAKLKIEMGETDIQKINPSKFKTGTDSVKVKIKGITIQTKPDHPVESLSDTDAIEFVDGLNRLSNSDDTQVQQELIKLIPDHKKYDVYGLPSEVQWKSVMQDRGNADKKHFDREDETDLPFYSWYSRNANGQTHPVETKQPRMIDRGDGVRVPFYDMEGNVQEWSSDHTIPVSVEKYPQPGATDPKRLYLGGGWKSYAEHLGANHRNFFSPGYSSSSDVGLRLVRTRP